METKYFYLLKLFKSFTCCGFIFKEDPPLQSFRLWNPRIRDLFQNEEDWDYELEYIDLFNIYSYKQNSSISLMPDVESDEDDDEEIYEEFEEMEQELSFYN